MSASLPSFHTVTELPLQNASLDIWETKYRLKTKNGDAVDQDIDATYQRVAKALAAVEKTKDLRKKYYQEFLWVLRQGAIPAGRIISNAGAEKHKPATSTINCTVSGIIEDSMDDILDKVHEAGLTLKAGCVAPHTLVVTEKGYVTAKQAVTEKHRQILSYDKKTHCFEMQTILKHLVTHVPQNENIEIESHLGTLTTSIKHPVLVYRHEKLQYVRADEIVTTDALVHHQLEAKADKKVALKAWFAGAHLGDGSAYEKKFTYASSQGKWKQQAEMHGKRLVFKIRAAEREVVERYALFFKQFYHCHAQVVSTVTPNNTPVWDFTVASFKASAASELIDNQIGKKTATLKVPKWIKQNPERYFLPFLAGLIDTDGTIAKANGSAILSCQNKDFIYEIQSLLALFGIHGGITHRKARSHIYNGNEIKDSGGHMITISDSAFLLQVSTFMADSCKKNRIKSYQTKGGQYDHYVITAPFRDSLKILANSLSRTEKRDLGFYYGKHEQTTISRVYLDKWTEKFPQLKTQIDFIRTLRPVKAIKRHLDIGETFYDFTVDTHNNYLAGNNALIVLHNCGIGYEFSTLRPKDAYVSGAGAYTSGPLSFMDIYDKMCFTVSSAGGRRGAQMATFDICHPDVIEFIRAKREDGRLRQFNLSLLITSEFIEAVKNKADWPLSFPVTTKEVKEDNLDLNDAKQIVWRELSGTAQYVNNSDGLVACKIIKTIPAQRLWDIIMSSTYDYAEPGFILIDEANKMNNNWFCESLRTSNPCVTADTWVQTKQGAKQVSALLGQQIQVLVDGKLHLSGVDGFFKTATKKVVKLITKEGFSLRLTDDHRLRKITNQTSCKQETQWCTTSNLKKGDKILLNNHREFNSWKGKYTQNQGYLMGLLVGDGTLKKDKAVLSVWKTAQVVNIGVDNINAGIDAMMEKVLEASKEFSIRCDFNGWAEIKDRNEYRLSFSGLKDLTDELGMSTNKVVTPEIESASSDFYQGFLQGFFDADGSVQGTQEKGVSVRLAQSDLPRLEAVQRMLLRLGIKSSIYRNRRPAGIKKLPNGKGGHADYQIKAQHELVVSGDNLISFQKKINFTDTNKALKLKAVLNNYKRQLNRERFTVIVEGIIDDGVEDVFDIQVPGINTFDANGLHAHNCGEQILPPYGSCLLGSINLTRFIKKPFTNESSFDWDTYRKVIRIFTRMLDNVVEINGLPLEKQREEIISKRRHGMGYLGLGSTVTMLGMKYGDEQSLQFTDEITKVLAIEGWKEGLALAKEKGVAPILEQIFTVTGEMLHKRPEMVTDGYNVGDEIAGKVLHAKYSRYMQKIAEDEPELIAELIKVGARFTHATSIAPTGCVVPNTLIVTDKGLQKIENLGDTKGQQWQEVNFKVSTDEGFKEVTQFFINGEVETVKITTSNGRIIEATPNHQIRVICPETGYIWKKLEAIKQGDVIPSLVDNYPMDLNPEKMLKVELNQDEGHYWNRGHFRSPDFLDENIAEFIGFLHANGNIKTERHIRLFHHIDYAEQAFEHFSKTLKTCFNIEAKLKQLEGDKYLKLKELHIHSLNLVNWLRLNNLSKESSVNIRIPNRIMQGGRKIINAYIRGLFEGDGSIYGNAISFTSVSESFILELQVLIQSIGMVAKKDISVKADSKGHKGDKDVYRLSINHYMDRQRFIANIGFISNKGNIGIESSRNHATRQLKKSILATIGLAFNRKTRPAIRNQIAIFQESLSNEVSFEEVVLIEEGFAQTYDLSVPENVTYTANNLVSHNTISLSLANNASNGIEPSFAHHYSRNVIRQGKKSKEKIDVYSFELLAYRELINPEAMPYSENPELQLPDYFISADSVTPKQHVDVQAAAQQWIDSSISKTANVPTDYPYEDFKDIYQYAYEKGLKGCTTFRFNPEVFQGVLVKETDLENTVYEFTLEDGTKIELKGNEEVEYDGEMHSAANLFDALKEGYYGKF